MVTEECRQGRRSSSERVYYCGCRFSGKPCSSSTPRRSRWQSSWDLSTRYPSRTSRGHTRWLLPLCMEGDIIIDHGNSNFKDSRRRAERLSPWASNILTVVLVVVFMVWSVDTVLWLGVQILQYGPAVQSLTHSHQASLLPLEPVTEMAIPLP